MCTDSRARMLRHIIEMAIQEADIVKRGGGSVVADTTNGNRRGQGMTSDTPTSSEKALAYMTGQYGD